LKKYLFFCFLRIVHLTGTIGVRGTLYVHVSKDGQLIDTLRSDEQYVGNKKTGIFSTSFRPTTVGNYSFEAYLSYGIKETNRRTVSAAAFSPNLAFSFPWQTIKTWLFACTPRFVPLILLILIFILTALLLKYVSLWRKHELCECSTPCDCHQNTSSIKKNTIIMSAQQQNQSPTKLQQTPPAFTPALPDPATVPSTNYTTQPVSKTTDSPTRTLQQNKEDEDPLEKFLQ
jgi:hypothetical protein